MALLEKILSTKRKLNNDFWDSRNRVRSCEIALEQVRLLLYRECDRRGRKVLFDSSTIERVTASKNDKPDFRDTGKVPCVVEVTEGFTYIYKGEAGDARVLGEMIFGAVAMNCKSVSLKIHIMNDPKRLMCTKLFSVPRSRRVSRGDRIPVAKSSGDLSGGSKPLSVPQLSEEGVSLSFSLDRGDSGFCGERSPHSSAASTCDYFSMFDTWEHNSPDDYCFYTPSRKLSCCSSGSWQRRTFQSTATRFHFASSCLQVPTSSTMSSSDSQLYSNSSSSGTTDSLASSSVTSRRGKLGLALLISVAESVDMDLVRRCLEQSPQLQALVCRLRLAALTAGVGHAFVSTLYRATEDAARWLSDVMFGPRTRSVWLELLTSEPDHSCKLASSVLTDLCSVLTVGDTKNTNFFISTLLTYVLTHHLGWVTTVSPYDTVEDSTRELSDSRRPYNALWAQLTDLCGSVGFPPRCARTIITGTNVKFMNKLLAVLTYFVRCGDVKKNDFEYQQCVFSDAKVVKVNEQSSDSGRTAKRSDECLRDSLRVPSFNRSRGSSVSTLVASEGGLKKSTTLADLSQKLSSSEFVVDSSTSGEGQPRPLRRQPTMMISLKDSSDSGSNLSTSEESDKVVFVLGDDEKLVGLKNKSNGGKRVKKSSKIHNEPVNSEAEVSTAEVDEKEKSSRSTASPSKCCAQTLQHSKPIKHSGFKFEFDKYPQIVTNYMKSKNLEILDRHYIGKPGNLKLDNFQFDPTLVPPIPEESCETCYKCQLMESMLQTPTNASEMEYMNDTPRQTEPQFAKESIVQQPEHREMSPKTFVRKRKENTVVVNVTSADRCARLLKDVCTFDGKVEAERALNKNDRLEVKQVIEFPLPPTRAQVRAQVRSGCDVTLLGGVTNHYVPDLVLQGTLANPTAFEAELRRDLDLSSYLHKTAHGPVQTVAIVGDTNAWEVRLVGRACGGGGLSPLVGGMLDALTAMRRARIPTHQCLIFVESKLREFCVMSKTLADMLMSTDFCDIATLTRSLDVDVNDVPLLLAIATTHTPQLARRYGISYR